MKKVFMIAAIAAASMSVNAQTTFGVQVGGNMGNIKEEYTIPGEPAWESKYDSKFGFLIGAVASVPLSENLSFRPELNFIQKGAEMEENSTETSGGFTTTTKSTGDVTLSFIELPLNIVYNVPAGAGTFFIGAGPSVGFGIGGKYESKGSYTITGTGFPTQSGSYEYKGDVKFDGKKESELAADDNDMHLKGLDFGANFLAGYKMSNGMFLSLGYTMGFSNLNPNENASTKTNGLQLKIGYMFGGGNTNGAD